MQDLFVGEVAKIANKEKQHHQGRALAECGSEPWLLCGSQGNTGRGCSLEAISFTTGKWPDYPGRQW